MSDDEVEKLRRQAVALSRFGDHALHTRDLQPLLQEATELVSHATGIELVKVLELLPDGDTMLVRAGVGWKPGVVGHATFEAHSGSPGGYALRENRPVISPDTDSEDRFGIPQLLVDHGVKSMINVMIRGERAAWGVLEVDSKQCRDFNEDDVAFLRNYANLLAAAIERLQVEAELREAADRANILLGELQHRVRNMLLNVQSLARRTAKTSTSLEGFGAAFEARLLALMRTQELIAGAAVVSVRLEDTLRQELNAHGAEHGTRVLLSGPEVRLPPRLAQPLGMAFHELATNATKYGALRHPDGRLKVSWRVVPGEQAEDILVVWRESGVPVPGPPTRRGFGSETIEKSLPYMLGGKSAVQFHSDGIECIIRFPFEASGGVTPSRDGQGG